MNFGLRLEPQLLCTFCKENQIGRSPDMASLTLFGFDKFAVCPKCLLPVSSKKKQDWQWRQKVQRWWEKQKEDE